MLPHHQLYTIHRIGQPTSASFSGTQLSLSLGRTGCGHSFVVDRTAHYRRICFEYNDDDINTTTTTTTLQSIVGLVR